MPMSDEAKLMLLTACRMPVVRDEVVAALDAALVALPGTLTSAHIFVGNGSAVPTDVALSGDATLANTGAITLGTTAVTGKALTGLTPGAGTVSATDTILQAFNKLTGNVGTATAYTEATFVATFTQGVGAKTVVVRKWGKMVTVEIPTGSTADGGGGSIASGAGDMTAAYRPAADLSFPVVVSDNAAKVFGRLVISSAGTLTFTASAAGGNFTDDAAAGFDRCAVSYTTA